MNRSLKIPAIIIVIGLIAAIAVSLLTGMVKAPAVTEQDFPYSVTYSLDGDTKTFEGTYRCRFLSTGEGTDPLERYYEGTYLTKSSENHSAAYTIAEKDGFELCIVTIFSDRYLMGDAGGAAFHYDPYLAVLDSEGMEFALEEMPGMFDAEIIGWEYPESVENTFKFVGFSKLHDTSMIVMLCVGIQVMVACMIAVKRDKSIPYKTLDKVSAVLNFVAALAFIPFSAVIAWLMQIYVSGDEFVYQVNLCVPAITAFTVAASIALRRKGYTKSGFFVQFIGPVLFALMLVLESVM